MDGDPAFGLIQPTLIQQIKKILDEYPDDGQILKELVQNAEDAGAKKVKFLIDHHSYPTASLHHRDLKKFQGPALYAYNNAKFTANDWRGVGMLCDSIKVNDPTKVGRFGLGFKSVFHMTDLPSVVSGNTLGIIDPHEKYFSDDDGKRSGMRWKLNDPVTCQDQFTPYKGIFDCTEDAFKKGIYDGTLFRLPFRQKPSKLSDTIYEESKIQGLIESFKTDAHLILLFLMNLERIEIYERKADKQKAVKLYSVSISKDCKACVQAARQRFNLQMNDKITGDIKETYTVNIGTFDCRSNTRSNYSFAITHLLSRGNLSTEMEKLKESLSYMPRVGVAFPLNTNTSVNKDDPRDPKGHVFCFLPLPLETKSLTGLPVHVNGFFALSQNRRYLKWRSTDQTQTTDKSLLWNEGLLREVLPKAYAELILYLIADRKSPEIVYAAWPDLNKIDVKWKRTAENVFRLLLLGSQVFYTDANSGSWCKLNDVTFDSFTVNSEIRKTVIELLNNLGQKIVTVPSNVRLAVNSLTGSPIKEITPSLVRETLKCNHPRYVNLPREKKLSLLKYILEDSQFSQLEGLELLPLSNKTFACFRAKTSTSSYVVYIDSCQHPRSLLPGMENIFLDTDIDEYIKNQLKTAVHGGYTQLCKFDSNAFKKHLGKAIPSEWMQSNGHVTWCPGKPRHPPQQWLEDMWKYLNKYFNQPNCLDKFCGIPLIPIKAIPQGVILGRIQKPSTLLLSSFNFDSLESSVKSVASAFGVTILECLPEYVSSHRSLIPWFINPPNPKGLLTALSLVVKSSQPVLDRDARPLRPFFSQITSPAASEINLLKRLKLFDTCVYTGCGEHSSPVALANVPLAAPVNDLPCVRWYTEMIDVSYNSSRSLAQLLGTLPMRLEDLVKIMLDHAANGIYSNTELDDLIKFTLDRLGLFSAKAVQKIKQQLTTLPFVTSANDTKKRVGELFDPKDNNVVQLFLDEPDKFPKAGSYYSSRSVLLHLRNLGLKKQQHVTASEVLNSARMINKIDTKRAMVKSTAILDLLNMMTANASLLKQLNAISWVPVVHGKPDAYPTALTRSKQNPFARPKDVTSIKFRNLIGSFKQLIDDRDRPNLSQQFGWNKSPSIQDAIIHLRNVICCYQREEKNTFVIVIQEVYRYLAMKNVSEVLEVLSKQEVHQWVWNGDGFSSTSEVIENEYWLNLKPYLYSLPSDMKKYAAFFYQCGMKKECDSNLLLEILQRMKERHSECTAVSHHEVRRDLQYSIDILNVLKPSDEEGMDTALRGKLLVPVDVEGNTSLELVAVDECTYCDREWLKQGHDVCDIDDTDDINIKFIHRNIPIATAEVLNVPTLMSRILDADELEMGESFGQSESLLDRLKSLLEGYTDGLSVPKELIQNADDAGATEVCFLYDERTNDSAMTHLIDEGMKECHGPALWSYNDAVFTDQDFENVVKLNAATKEEDTGKIGRFGLGFNSVYNLTDVPSFVSRNSIVILDPHTNYLGKAIRDKSKPGIKINSTKKTFDKLQNQFKPFNGIFGCDLSPKNQHKSYDGTLFRLPLRTASQAQRSQIKNLCYDRNQVKDLLHILLNGAESLLLFTQNVLKVRVFHLRNEDADPSHAIELFCISKSCEDVIHRLQCEISLSKPVQKLSVQDQELVRQSSVLKASTNLLKESTVVKDTASQTLMKSSMILSSCCTLSDHGRDFLNLDDEQKSENQNFWLVHSCMVSGQSLAFSQHTKGIVPTAGVAAKLRKLPSEKLVPSSLVLKSDVQAIFSNEPDLSGIVFCFLPLPIHSGLPIHINGCFALDDSRRHLREITGDDKVDKGAQWNRILMNEVVVQAFLGLLRDAKSKCTDSGYNFHILWPVIGSMQHLCDDLVRSFYQILFSDRPDLELFSDGTRWSSIHNIVFLEPSFRKDEKIGQTSFDVFRSVLQKSRLVIDIPEEVFLTFKSFELTPRIQDLCFDKERFYREVFFPCIDSVEESQRNNLVLYAIDDKSDILQSLLSQYPCIPSSPCGVHLKCPKELIHPSGKAALLYTPNDGRFPCGDAFCTKEHLFKLKKLGMCEDDLEWEAVVERAKSVTSLKSYHISLRRTQLLIHFINSKLKDNGQVENISQAVLQKVAFLPFMAHPSSFPSKWKGDEYKPNTFFAANDLYRSSKKYLVGASEPIVNDEKNGCGYLSSNVARFLGLRKKVSLVHLKYQMQSVIEVGSTFEPNNSESVDELSKACTHLYGHFQDHLKVNGEEVVNFLSALPFILGRTQFLMPGQVAFSSTITYEPFLSQVLPQFSVKFRDILQRVGVRESFQIKDYLGTLSNVFSSQNRSTVKEHLPKVIEILNTVESLMKKKEMKSKDVQDKYGTIYVPDSKCVMRPSEEICINDCYWMDPTEVGVKYANEDIPFHTCLALGVNSRRQEALRSCSFGIDFGQSEKLTNRLKRILDGYPCDGSIMKELLQNADDAKATKVCFIKDSRHHPDERVFEDCWKPLQGPALCVFNDAPFTDNDLKGIQNLGEGSKGHDPNKTGQYGVGFNAVYHLTDAPSFLSKGKEIREVMCVFDPNLKYVPSATEQHPGRQYKDLPYLRKKFTDVFPCYLEEQLSLDEGTVFRFPLRTEEMANASNISISPMSLDKLDELLDEFKGELLKTLLFVNNLKEISICDVDKSGKLVEIYHARASLSKEDKIKRDVFASYVKQVSAGLCNESMTIDEVSLSKVSYVLNLTDSKGECQKWLVNQQIGFSEDTTLPEEIKNAYKKGELGLLPRGGVALLINETQKKTAGNAFCFLPLPFETGLPVHVNGHFALDHEARRSLWRSEKGDYRSLWNEILLQDVVSSCYVDVLDEVRKHMSLLVIAESKTFLQKTHEEVEAILLKFASYFPSLDSCESPWNKLASEVYRQMERRKSRLLPVIRHTEQNQDTVVIEWLPPTGDGREKALFDNLTDTKRPSKMWEFLKEKQSEEVKKKKKKNITLRETLRAVGVNLVFMPINIYTCFENSNVPVSLVSPVEVIDFFATYHSKDRLCKLSDLPRPIEETPFKDVATLLNVVCYCKQDEIFYQRLNGLPLLLTEDGNLRVFDESQPVFRSGYSELVPNSSSLFLQCELHNCIFALETNLAKTHVCKVFDISAFATLLPKELHEATYKSTSTYIEWFPLKKTTEIPTKTWISRVWRFLSGSVNKLIKDYEENNKSSKKGMSSIPYDARKKKEKEDKKAIILNALQPVMNWCLLPAFEALSDNHPDRCKHYLVPLTLAYSLISYKGSILMDDVKGVLKKLSIPEINSVLINKAFSYSSFSEIPEQLVANLEDPTSILRALVYKLNHNASSFEVIDSCDCVTILQYFDKHLEHIDEDVKSSLKKLPLYVTIHGRQTSIENKKVFLLSWRIPKDGIDLWDDSSVVFLKKMSSLENLYKCLGCDTKDEVEAYCEEIFQRFGEMSGEARLKHLEFIRELFDKLVNERMLSDLNEKEARKMKNEKLCQALKMLKFIPGENGILEPASSFFDPSNDVFKVMFEKLPEMFPRHPFCEMEWLLFLRKIGLTHEVSNEQYLQFAREVEVESRQNLADLEETRKKSKTLICYLFNKLSKLTSCNELDGSIRDFLFNLNTIRYICADKVSDQFKNICAQYGMMNDRLPWICFKDSVVSGYLLIAWTSTNLLPGYTNSAIAHATFYPNIRKKVVELLGILHKPSVNMVITHCQNICGGLLQRPHNPKMDNKKIVHHKTTNVVDIMTNIYTFLLNEYREDESETAEKLSTLKDTRCLFVDHGHRFIYPKQAAAELKCTDQIRPYLFQLPIELGTYIDLFEHLGTTRAVSPAQYAMVLRMVHDESIDGKLHPNEINCAFKATKGLFESLKQNTGDSDPQLSPLYLPGTKGSQEIITGEVVLQLSTDILYNDAPRFKERLQKINAFVLLELEKVELEVSNDEDLLNKLPESLLPQKLSSLVRETLVEDNESVSRSKTAMELDKVLIDPNFCYGIIRLIKHVNYSKKVETSSDIVTKIKKSLSCIKVYSAFNLRTRLLFDGHPIPESEAEVTCFEELTQEQNQEILKIYIKEGSETELYKFSSRVAEIVNRITGRQLGEMLVHLAPMLSLKSNEINSFLDELNIRADNALTEITNESYVPDPGSFVCIDDHHLLVDAFTIFYPGDFVGYELDDPSLRDGYELDDPSLRDESDTPTYIYAIIIDDISLEENSPPYARRYRVDIGTECIDIDAVDLYQIYRCKQESDKLEIEQFTGANTSAKQTKPDNFEEVKQLIRRTLEDAWKLPEEMKKKIIKRLMLTWHPDKNPGNEEFCNEVFKFLLSEMQRLEEGFTPEQAYNFWGSGYRDYDGCYSGFYNDCRDRAGRHRTQRNTYYSRGYSGGYSSRSTRSGGFSNPQPGEAKRWYKQASADLEAACNDVMQPKQSYEWACFKCHQSAEKALKAAQYLQNANTKTNTHYLPGIAMDLGDSDLESLASSLESLLGNSTSMRYPDRVTYPRIPHDIYSKNMAERALDIARQILGIVTSKLEN